MGQVNIKADPQASEHWEMGVYVATNTRQPVGSCMERSNLQVIIQSHIPGETEAQQEAMAVSSPPLPILMEVTRLRRNWGQARSTHL